MSKDSNKSICLDLSLPDSYQSYVEPNDVVIWLQEGFEKSWFQNGAQDRTGRRETYSQSCIELILTLKSLLGFSLRRIIDLLNQAFRMLEIELPVPDHSQLSRRSKTITNLPSINKNEKVAYCFSKNGFEFKKQEQIETTKMQVMLMAYVMVLKKTNKVGPTFILNQSFEKLKKEEMADRRRIIFVLYKNLEQEINASE